MYKSSEMAVQHTKFYVFAQGDSAEEHHVVTSELQFELVDLNKFTEYSVWVVAFNQNGPGSSTEEVVCRTLSDVPSEPPQNVTLEASSSTVSERSNICTTRSIISATVGTDTSQSAVLHVHGSHTLSHFWSQAFSAVNTM